MSPTAGTDPLAAAMKLTQITNGTTGTNLEALVQFTSGDHSSILDPTSDAIVTNQIQTAAANFLLNDGGELLY